MARALKKDTVLRIYLLFAVMVLAAFAIIFRIVQIQFVENDKWEAKAQQQTYKYFDVKAIRGNIYSDDFSLLATSVPIYNLFWDSKVVDQDSFFNNLNALANGFAEIYPEISASKFKNGIKRAYERKNRYYRIKRNVSYSELKRIKALPIFNMGIYRGGLISEKMDRRKRPYKMLAKRTIGNYSTYKNAYVVGLEGAYDEQLKGVDGVRIKQKTSGGWRPLYAFDETIKEPVDGVDIITTIDVNLQDVAESSLYKELMKHKADWGCAVLMEVKTGRIKAIANLKYDTASNTYYEGFNYAIGTATEPGSTFKLATMMVSLDNNIVRPDELIETGNGAFTYYGKTIHDSHGYGDITVSQVLEKSSNVGVFKIALKGFEKQPRKFINGIHAMRLNKPLGLEIRGEAKPYIKTPEDNSWSGLSLPWMSIGYELQLTPMQVLNFYNAVANGGKMVKPTFVKETQKTGITQQVFEPVILQEQISTPKTIKQVQKMLEGVVLRGTAKALRNSPYPIAGKTGTAQISNKKGYNKRNYQASFVGYFPADNPEYSCIVVVNNPKSGLFYASTVAVPVFKEIADKIYATDLKIQAHAEKDTIPMAPNSKVGLQKDIIGIYDYLKYHTINNTPDVPYVAGYSSSDTIKIYQRKIEYGVMPNLKNMTAKDAIFMLEELGLKIEMQGMGKVISQSIAAGVKVRKGQIATIKLQF